MILLKIDWDTGAVAAHAGRVDPDRPPLFVFPAPARAVGLPTYEVLRPAREALVASGISTFDVKSAPEDIDRICGKKWERHALVKSSDRQFDCRTFGSTDMPEHGTRIAHCLACLSTLTRPTIPCPRCDGKGREEIPFDDDRNAGEFFQDCRLCDSDGKVSEALLEDRAAMLTDDDREALADWRTVEDCKAKIGTAAGKDQPGGEEPPTTNRGGDR